MERKGYVYRFIGMNNQILYIGKTINLNLRMKNHFSSKSHLAHTDLYSKVQRIEYITCKSEYEALQKELMYINYYKPRYNSASKIKQLIDPPSNDKWKVWKVIKEMPREQQKQNDRIAKLLPIAMCLFFFSIIGLYLFK